ncbi:cytidylyltransferase domain-containing protein [Paenibacillus sp. PAMC21692]|uniref:cytidylyltransferase domain-containing protein n=1 Tax=Paenibacillus sp. PAMC21692 TaxID=2762320 RepID=UPI00164EC8C3|nr:glycosyltransferase family protein [Paenibacillus sp. PAMC21692]QNK58376.1 glycosyltransferase family protein [Paenibacillus sp. PAMC21692]
MSNILVIIQARVGSTRLRGKVLKVLGDRTVLGHVINRCKAIPSVNEVMVATTTLEQDDAICNEAAINNVNCYRGNEQDVLSRYYEAAVGSQADAIVRITSDCPLLDPNIVEALICFFYEQRCDYARVGLDVLPRGLDAEIFTFGTLQQAHERSTSEYEREHVTPYIIQNSDKFNVKVFRDQDADVRDSLYRLTLDTIEDWNFITRLYNELYKGKIFGWKEVKKLLEANPEFVLLNAHVEQKTAP